MNITNRIEGILAGINQYQTDEGYWKTSEEVEFGQSVLDEALDSCRLMDENYKASRAKIKDLKKQLSNSISKDELRGLVEDIDNLDTTCATGRLGADSVLSAVKIRLNKLIEGDNNG